MSEHENNQTSTEMTVDVAALMAYLANYEPDPSGTSLKTTDAIVRELDDMVEVGSDTVARVMLEQGFSIVWHPNGRHGWGMRLLV